MQCAPNSSVHMVEVMIFNQKIENFKFLLLRPGLYKILIIHNGNSHRELLTSSGLYNPGICSRRGQRHDG